MLLFCAIYNSWQFILLCLINSNEITSWEHKRINFVETFSEFLINSIRVQIKPNIEKILKKKKTKNNNYTLKKEDWAWCRSLSKVKLCIICCPSCRAHFLWLCFNFVTEIDFVFSDLLFSSCETTIRLFVYKMNSLARDRPYTIITQYLNIFLLYYEEL